MNKIVLLSLFVFVLVVSSVYAQPTGGSSGGPSVTITTITTSDSRDFGPMSRDPKVKTKEEDREPKPEDVINALKDKAQVAITVPQANETARWAHTMRVRAVNLTTYNSTNEDNKTVYYNDILVYDPTTGNNYTTQMASIEGDSKGYVLWYGWVHLRTVVIIKAHAPAPKPRGTLLYKPGQYGFLPLTKLSELFLPKFH